MNIFLGYEDFVHNLGGGGGHHKIGLVWGSFLCNLGSFFKVKVQNWDIFLGLLKFQIFFGVLEIPDIFFGWTVYAGSEPTYAEKIRVPPPPWELHTRHFPSTI